MILKASNIRVLNSSVSFLRKTDRIVFIYLSLALMVVLFAFIL